MVLLNPVDGDQTKLPLPLAMSVVFAPLQMVTSVPAFTEGEVLIVTVTSSSMLPQEFVTVTV